MIIKLIQSILFICSLIVAIFSQNPKTPEEKLDSLGLKLPEIPQPLANYVSFVRVGNLVFLSGAGPIDEEGMYICGKVGKEFTVEEAYQAAQLVALRHLAILKDALGSLDKVSRLVKVLGMVNCTENFEQQPKVINGYSDLMVKVFGETGKHARSAIGVNALPFNMLVEIELIAELKEP